MIKLESIKLMPARERVASVLRKAIISQEMSIGEKITLSDVADSLGISKTPVREALQMLETEGLIKLEPNKVAIILEVTPETIRDHFQIRMALESEAVAIICENNEDLSEISNIINESENIIKEGKWAEYTDLNQAFHLAIWSASKNERLKNMLSVMWNGLSMQYSETLEEYAVKSFEEHKELFKMIQIGDTAKATAMMRNHIKRSMDDMLTNICSEKLI